MWTWVPFIAAGLLLLRPRSSWAAWSYEIEADSEPLPTPDPQPPPKPQPGLSPLWPLPTIKRAWKNGSFGSPRPYGAAQPTSHHKGIDIAAPQGAPVVAMMPGKVVAHSGWRGPNTSAVIVQSFDGPVLVYGAVSPEHRAPVGAVLKRGEMVGRIGRYPGGSTMLHLEIYRVGTRKRPEWLLGKPQPAALVNPEHYLAATVDS